MKQNLNPIRGFRDLYPEEKSLQNYIFGKIRQVANIFGFEEYDGPILEPISLYLDKTSQELIERQTFQVKTKKDETLILRPEMTPSLARMIAQRPSQIVYPAKLFNLGLRFRYEAPQKGRTREFYQADFDILGADSLLADAEILNVAVNIFLNLGAWENDFVVNINSREFMNSALMKIGLSKNKISSVINAIDKKDKVSEGDFEKMLVDATDKNLSAKIKNFLSDEKDFKDHFKDLFEKLDEWGIKKYIKVSPTTVRGLDYYTGLVFEVSDSKSLNRALLGGGRYDNLISKFSPNANIGGVGFATSDVVLEEFLNARNLFPKLNSVPTKVLVTIFPGYEDKSINLVNSLRNSNIPSEIYLKTADIRKQLEYANKKSVPFVILIGADEVKKNVITLKDMISGSQQTLTLEAAISKLKN